MELRQLRHLTAVLQRASFSAAANDLNITQPALSKSLRTLEKSLGVRLLDRGPNGTARLGVVAAVPEATVLGQVGDPYESLERRLDDAGWVAGRLAEILPLPPAQKQQCLELDDPIERLRFLRPLFEITTEPPTAGIEPDDD